ncbi:18036_t:CDS:2 [Gigaspora rosea]|nr:18036_t:CDS:2 [Gigaspora rosea]
MPRNTVDSSKKECTDKFSNYVSNILGNSTGPRDKELEKISDEFFGYFLDAVTNIRLLEQYKTEREDLNTRRISIIVDNSEIYQKIKLSVHDDRFIDLVRNINETRNYENSLILKVFRYESFKSLVHAAIFHTIKLFTEISNKELFIMMFRDEKPIKDDETEFLCGFNYVNNDTSSFIKMKETDTNEFINFEERETKIITSAFP